MEKQNPAQANARPAFPIRGLVFDMDGTILDTQSYHKQAWREMVARHGLTARHYEAAVTTFGTTNAAIFQEWFKDDPLPHDFGALGEEKESLFRQLIKGKERPRPGFAQLAEWARGEGMKIALATSAPPANAEFLLRDTGIARCFDAVLSCDGATRGKPHPDLFLNAAQVLGVPARQCLVFEDSVYGFEAAQRAEMALIAIAEQPEDLAGIREKWTPHVFLDFRPIVPLLTEWKQAAGPGV